MNDSELSETAVPGPVSGTDAGAPHDGGPEFLTLADLVRFVRRNLWIIVGASLAMTAVVVAVMLLFRPLRYEAVATLVIAPQRFRSDLKPPILPVQGYQRLLESSSVVAATVDRLRDQGVLDEGRSLQLDDEIRTRIFVSQRAEETALAPMIEVVAEASRPEDAATIANTWCETFLERARQIQEDSVGPIIRLIDTQYHEERQRLIELTEEETRLANEYQVRLDELSLIWDRRLVDARKRTEDVVSEHNVETRRRMEEFAASAGVGLSDGGLLEDPAAEPIPDEVERRLLQILSLRIQLAQTPRLLVLEKAVSDDTLWQTMAFSENGMLDLHAVLDRRLVTEEANPVYGRLVGQLAEIEIAPESVRAEVRRRAHRFLAGLERLQADRTAELTKLLADRALVMDDLARQRAQEMRALERERRMELEQLSADIAQQRELFEKLAENHSEAGLAEAEQVLQEVRLGAPAVPPARPESRQLLFKALAAAVVGGVVGLVVALVREVEMDAPPVR